MSRAPALLQAAAGIGALCAMDAIVKHLTRSNSVELVTLGRYVTGSALALGVWQWQGRPAITRAMLPVHLARGILIATMAFTFYYGVSVLPLAETLTIAFIAPLLVAPLASLTLGEPMRARYVAASLIGFAGVAVTVHGAPDFSGERLLALAAVLYSAVAYAASAVILRARAASDGATIITLMGAVVPMLVLSPIALRHGLPDGDTIVWLIIMGVCGNIGMQFLARAYARLEAQILAVMEFTGLPWAALFGWLFFAEPVRPQVWVGAAIILAACIWASRGEQQALAA